MKTRIAAWMGRFVSGRSIHLARRLLQSLRNDFGRVRHFDVRPFCEPGAGFRLNVGCGTNPKPGWVNIDLAPQANLRIDARDGLPFEDHSCDLIYSEHFLEHLIYPDESVPFLRECRRIMRADGRIEIGVPDARRVVAACSSTPIDPDFLAEIATHDWGYPDTCETGFEYLNYHFRMDEHHKFAFDFETLRAQLQRAGFVQVRRRDFDRNLDTPSRGPGTLYVSAVAGPFKSRTD